MEDRASPDAVSTAAVKTSDLLRYADEWLLDCRLKLCSPRTIAARQDYLRKFFWFLEYRDYKTVSNTEIKAFMGYLIDGHGEPGGRWGNPTQTQPMRPVSMDTYYRLLRALCNWMIEEEITDFDLMRKVKKPVVRLELKQPAPKESVRKLFEAVKETEHPRRNEAIVWVLLDTGLRAAEICSIKMNDLDFQQKCITVIGKGDKPRMVFIGQRTIKALMKYLRREERTEADPLFISKRGEALKPSGLYQLMKRLSKKLGFKQVIGPHTMRRTFAVDIQHQGATVFATQVMLGHTDIRQTRIYSAIAQADCETQHAKYSPADHL